MDEERLQSPSLGACSSTSLEINPMIFLQKWWQSRSQSSRKKRPLNAALVNRLLAGLYLDGVKGHLYLRLTDAVLMIDLDSRDYKYGGRHPREDYWLALPGLLRIARVISDTSQVQLVCSGAVYSSIISLRNAKGWRIVFDGRHVPLA